MATTKPKTQPIGSTAWIDNEREQSSQFVSQEVEEFTFSVRNELDWLNEHMAGIFSRDAMNFADVFKTPGKLRGKTPRTARKRDVGGVRQPLSDIFAPNMPALQSAQKGALPGKITHFHIPEDAENHTPATRPTSRSKSPQRIGKPGNTDSGYHGMTEDEMDIDIGTQMVTASSQLSVAEDARMEEHQPALTRSQEPVAEVGTTSDDSFESARENLNSRMASRERPSDVQIENAPEMDVEMTHGGGVDPSTGTGMQENEAALIEPDHDLGVESPRSPSDLSSPEKPLQRKSSFTFTALPPRDLLKKSLGGRNSQVDGQGSRNSFLNRSFGHKIADQTADDEAEFTQEKAEETKVHNKTSTQLLHERITMLGKTKEPRPSKSIHQNAPASQPTYPQLPSIGPSSTILRVQDDDDDDWITPSEPTDAKAAEITAEDRREPLRPTMHQKSISTTQIPSPSRAHDGQSNHQKAISVSNPSLRPILAELQSTTPAGSPSGKRHDGPLSASKSKLYSVLKSAKSIFASSASTSAAAKLEAHDTAASQSPSRNASGESKTAAVFNMPGALYSDRQLLQSPSRAMSVISAISSSPSRKTRSSSESERKREKELKAQQKAEQELAKVREKERQRAAKQQEEKVNVERAEAARSEEEQQKRADRPVGQSTHGKNQVRDAEMPPPPPPKSMLMNGGKLRAPGRLVRPTKAEPLLSKPAPVSIRVGFHPQRLGQASTTSSFSKSLHDSSVPPPVPPKTANRPGSAHGSVKGNNGLANNRVKALDAAARKKEADEKVAQKKAEQKRELERKKAAKAEEERRVEEERKAAEQQRVQEAKMAAQRQAEKHAAEARRREQQRIDQQLQLEEAQKAKAALELAEAIKRERVQPVPHSRGDVGGTLRQISKNVVPDLAAARPAVQSNPAKPAKRPFQPEEHEVVAHQSIQPPQRPGLQRGPPSYQQSDAKRRRTNDEDQLQQPAGERHSVMAPPKRPSNMRKESTLSKFPHGYTHAPPSVGLHGPSIFKATVTAQHNLQHGPKPGMPSHPSQMVQVSNARIPFAENANPPAATQHHPHAQLYSGHENQHPGGASHPHQQKFKTPVRPAQLPKSAAKSSPLYTNGGDDIQLPEIATDSEEEEDSEDEGTGGGFRAPSWAASPFLRDLLAQQQLVDPETVFGPIGELKMDEVFKNGKNAERLKRFRDRGSSAAWIESGDAVTSAEKRRDMELRERVVREGGWRYEPTT